ncbi:hypothetical protein H8S33_06580 [Ornithinibacillus sp. BX22]|uniref:GNAT family acetyltransferase n=1 Tax=Ornithinibacillus hominis TaxID=2763055 RepID=A0A923RJM4_9BACI|nr:hypothetical protein [Ornithinibacillus hominis]MBC5636487.1 hypothetical protein [Ornithinibacillus hominis]
MTYTMKSYQPSDELQLINFITALDEDSEILHRIRYSTYKYVFLVYSQGEINGMIMAWKSSFHPNCTYFTCMAHHTEAAKALLAELERHLEQQDYPLQTIVDENDRLHAFYLDNLFTIIRKTYLPRINVLKDHASFAIPTNQVVKPLDEVTPHAKLANQLVALVKRNYEETHLVNPVATMELTKWRNLTYPEDLLASGSFVCLDPNEEKILAYSFLHEAERDDMVELGWCGAFDEPSAAIIPSLVVKQLEYAMRIGYQYVEGEFDTTSIYAMEVLHTLSLPKHPVSITYQKRGI